MTVLLGTDVLIDCLRGTPAARVWLEQAESQAFQVPGVVAMELLMGCRNKVELERARQFLHAFDIAWPEASEFALAYELLAARHLRFASGVTQAARCATLPPSAAYVGSTLAPGVASTGDSLYYKPELSAAVVAREKKAAGGNPAACLIISVGVPTDGSPRRRAEHWYVITRWRVARPRRNEQGPHLRGPCLFVKAYLLAGQMDYPVRRPECAIPHPPQDDGNHQDGNSQANEHIVAPFVAQLPQPGARTHAKGA